jgi:predicted dehydrogenase
MAALSAADKAIVAAIADPSPTVRSAVVAVAPEAEAVASLEKLLELELDGLVISSSGLCALQARVALEQGLAVFSELPMGRNAREAATLVEVAERADRLLAADRRYRHSEAIRRAESAFTGGALGEVYAAVFELHTRERRDLRPQLLDAVASALGDARILSACTIGGDIRLDFEGGTVAEISICSHADAKPEGLIIAELYGSTGTVSFESPADPPGDPALSAWVEKLANGARFCPGEVEGLVETAAAMEVVARSPKLLSRKTATA